MIVLRTYLAVLRRHGLIVLAYLTLFLLLTLIIGGGSQSEDPSLFEATRINLAFSQAPGDARGSQLADWFEGAGHRVSRVSLSEEEAREAVFDQTYQAVFLFEEGDPSVRVLVDERSADGFLAVTAADSFLRYLESFRSEEGGLDSQGLAGVLDQTMPVRIQAGSGGGNSGQLTAFLSSLAYILMLLSTTLIPLINQSFTEEAIRARSSLSPYPIRSRTLEMLIGSGLIVFGSALLLLTATLPLTHPLFEGGEWGQILANFSLFTLAVLGLSQALSALIRNRTAITAVSTVLSLGMAFLSGAFVPQPLLNKTAQGLARIFPLYYFIHGNRLMGSWADLASDLLIQAGFACFYFLLAAVATWYAKGSRRQLAA